jgi:hypothetical protein
MRYEDIIWSKIGGTPICTLRADGRSNYVEGSGGDSDWGTCSGRVVVVKCFEKEWRKERARGY